MVMYPYPQMVQRLDEQRRADLLHQAEQQRLYESVMDKSGRRGLAQLASRMLRITYHRHDKPTDGNATRAACPPALGATRP